MSVQLVDKLLQSFDELDRCIELTSDVLSKKQGVPGDVLSRIDQYKDIVYKQRSLASELKVHIENQNWTEVSRYVRLINGLSAMIRDDAQEILAGAFIGFSAQKDLVC